MIDLEAYCARVGYDGPREPTLEVLRLLHGLHPAAIPFEAIDVLLDRGVDLAPEKVDAKLLTARRGGYCFEHNSLFARALTAFGFEVETLIGRSLWNRPLDEVRPRTHMSLRVRLNGQDWLADVGFGGCMQTAPIRFDVEGPQETVFEPVRLIPVDGELRLEVLIAGSWLPICDIVPAVQHDADFTAANWYASTHPDSPFRHELVVTRTTPAGRFALYRNQLTLRRPGVPTERRQLDADQLQDALLTVFGLPVEPEWRPLLEHAVAAGRGV